MHQDIKKILISEREIQSRCEELGAIISRDYAGKKLVLVGLLKGSVPFISDLCKRITVPLQMEFMDVSSYHGGTASTGQIKVNKDLDADIAGHDVLIVEDIIDTGLTLHTVIRMLKLKGANSVKVVTLLDKPEGRLVELQADYIGFTIPKEFVVGYGLDYQQYYRNLPYVGVLKEEVYTSKEV